MPLGNLHGIMELLNSEVWHQMNHDTKIKNERVPPGSPDVLNTEFMYYSAALRNLAPALTGESDRQKIVPWIRKLFRPEYESTPFRLKRNKYLLYLTLTLLNDEAFGIFKTPPPNGALPEPEDMREEDFPPADWELDTMWRETLECLPDDYTPIPCSVHKSKELCEKDVQLHEILDQEFQFLLFLARPLAALLTNPNDRTRVAAWLQALCAVHAGASCCSMRGVRNDYMMALLGYINDLRVAGPFNDLPSWKTLLPLEEAARLTASPNAKAIHAVTDPCSPEANEFLAAQPIPNDGAFCYIAVTGELLKANSGGRF